MISERMLELSILNFLFSSECNIDGNVLDITKLNQRHRELLEEFLEPYVMDKAEKSE